MQLGGPSRLKQITLRNYRGFQETKVQFRDFNLVIGKNSAGKSSLIEALRMLSLVLGKLGRPSFERPPEWTGLDPTVRGIRVSLGDSDVNLATITHQYSDEPAEFKATFDDRSTISVYLRRNESMFATIACKGEFQAAHSTHLKQIPFPRIHVMPQVAPLAGEESLLGTAYVKQNLVTPVSRLHFRNHLLLFPEHYEKFKETAEDSWPGLRIRQFDRDPQSLKLMVQDGEFVGEVGGMGSGLQIWLQMLFFLARVDRGCIVALDEPDVYLHADMQRKLVWLLRGRFEQIILASHSVEIMAECKPREILVLDRKKGTSAFADSDAAIQKVIDELGGIHNIQVARLWGSKKCVLVEGKDMDLLRPLVKVLFGRKYSAFTTLPNFSIGGWSGLSSARGFARTYRSTDQNFSCYCIIDRDFRSDETVEKQLDTAAQDGLKLFVWRKKEIENYFIVPAAIARALAGKQKDRSKHIGSDEITHLLNGIFEELRDSTLDSIADALICESAEGKSHGVKRANPAARSRVEAAWQSFEGRISIVGGKEVFTRLNARLLELTRMTVAPMDVARELRKAEVHDEVRGVLAEILET